MEIANYLSNLNWQTICAMFAIGWYFTRDISATLKHLDADVRAQGERTDKLYEQMQSMITMQNIRSDKLYEMFCSLQKEMKDELKEFHGRVCVIETKKEGKK